MGRLITTEIFYSLQGEGKYTGIPSVFLRLWGCNFTCSGFDQTGTGGCDSEYSWHASHRANREVLEFDELYDRITNCLPDGQWVKNGRPVHLVISGGEPCLQIKSIAKFLLALRDSPLFVTIETNASIVIAEEAKSDLQEWVDSNPDRELLWSNSPKLEYSGELETKRINSDACLSQLLCHTSSQVQQQYKFVVRAPFIDDDITEVMWMTQALHAFSYINPAVYLMPLGTTDDDLNEKNTLTIANAALNNGYGFSDRLHIRLYGDKPGV